MLDAKRPESELAYCFGDHMFTWSRNDELKNFEKHYNELSKKSTSKLFKTAVQEANLEKESPGSQLAAAFPPESDKLALMFRSV